MTNDELARRVSEPEAAQLLKVVEALGQSHGYRPADVLRRLLFERDEWVARAKQQTAYADVSVAVDDQRLKRISELEAAIRTHRDERGDDRCWMDDATLYAVLPETVAPGELPPPEEMLENCKRFIALRYCQGEKYVSPQRRIEELEAEVARLRAGQAH